MLAAGLTRNLVAAKETVASTRTIGNMGEAFVFTHGPAGQRRRRSTGCSTCRPTRRGSTRGSPTCAAWACGSSSGQGLAGYETGGGRIRSVQLVDARGRRTRFTADWFVSAMPAEQARRFWSPAMRALDPHLAAMDDLFTDWMVGIQYYLRKPVEITKGHITFVRLPVGADGAHPGAVLERPGLPARLRQRRGGRLPLGRHLQLGRARGSCSASRPSSAPAPRSRRRSWPRSGCTRPRPPSCPTTSCTRGSSTRACSGTRPPGATPTRRRCWSTPSAPGRSGRRRARRSRTCSWPATTSRPTSTWPRWRAPTSPARTAVNALLDASGSSAERAATYKLYRSPALEAVKRTDAAALPRRSPQRPRRARRLTDTAGRDSHRPIRCTRSIKALSSGSWRPPPVAFCPMR